MTVIYSEEYRQKFPSYTSQPLSDDGISPLVQAYSQNREYWFTHAEEHGMSPDWFSDNRLIIGPFVHPTPTPTVYAGKFVHYERYCVIQNKLANSAIQAGYSPKVYDQVILGNKEFQDRGPTATDYLLIQGNLSDKEALKFASSGQRELPYNKVEFDVKKIASAINQIDQKLAIYANVIGVKAKHKRPVAQAIIDDLQTAANNSTDGTLVTLTANYNAAVNQRFNGAPKENELYQIDFDAYSRLLKNAVIDSESFLQMLAKIGYFQEASRLFIAFDRLTGEQIEVHGRLEQDKMSLYDPKTQSTLSWSDVQNFSHLLPYKELAYLMNMSSMVPTLYAGRNDDHLEVGKESYYHSYAWTKHMVENGLGLNSVFHRIQPQISDTYTNIHYPVDTVFHFYDQGLNSHAP